MGGDSLDWQTVNNFRHLDVELSIITATPYFAAVFCVRDRGRDSDCYLPIVNLGVWIKALEGTSLQQELPGSCSMVVIYLPIVVGCSSTVDSPTMGS